MVEPEVAGVVASVDRPEPSREAVELAGGEVVEIDTNDALELFGRGITADRLLLYGHNGGRAWYATLVVAMTTSVPDCYVISSDAAFDEPSSVILAFAAHAEFGIRLAKRDDFVPPSPNGLRSDGRYAAGIEGTSGGSFCVDPTGAVFDRP